MERRFVCQNCGLKWFIPGHRPSEPDLSECEGCGGPLANLANGPGHEGFGSHGDDDGEFGLDGE